MKGVIKKKGKDPKVIASPPLVHENDLLEQPPRVPATLEEFMPEDLFQSSVITYNMTSVICDGNPHLPRESQPTLVSHGSTILIDWLYNSLTYHDYSK